MQYEWNVTCAEELESLLNSFENQRSSFLAADGDARKDAERELESLGKRLMKAPKLAHATLALNYLVATGADAGNEDKSQSSHVRNAWMDNPADPMANVPDVLGGLPPTGTAAPTSLPRNSLLLRLDFTLEKPYLSKDDTAFHVLDNPVRKEWVFRVPTVASTSWKGALKATFWQRGHDENDPMVQRLFGNSRDDDDGQAGCLIFFPTYFRNNDVGIEMINPHDRAKGTGKLPIPFEAVRAGARGVFWLLYAPRDAAGVTHLADDLREIGEALTDLLSVYGVGAKVSSGYGTATPRGGRLFLRAAIPPYEEAGQTAATAGLEPIVPAGPIIEPADQWMVPLLSDEAGKPVLVDDFLRTVDEKWPTTRGKKPKGPPEEWKNYIRWYKHHAPAEPSMPVESEAVEPDLFSADFQKLKELEPIAGHIGRYLNPAPVEGEATDGEVNNQEVAP